MEVWLRPNPRPLLLGCLFPLIIAVPCGLVALNVPGGAISPIWRGLSWLMLAGCVALLFLLLWHALVPRLWLRRGRLWIRLDRTFAVPLEIVEGFLLGQRSTGLKGTAMARSEARTLVVRLSERAAEWERRKVHPLLGSWCDHYVTILGTWCEPLGLPLVHRLNEKLAEAQLAIPPREVVS